MSTKSSLSASGSTPIDLTPQTGLAKNRHASTLSRRLRKQGIGRGSAHQGSHRTVRHTAEQLGTLSMTRNEKARKRRKSGGQADQDARRTHRELAPAVDGAQRTHEPPRARCSCCTACARASSSAGAIGRGMGEAPFRDQAGRTLSGMGPATGWLKEALDSGKTLNETGARARWNPRKALQSLEDFIQTARSYPPINVTADD